jgi:hypothetical protein
VTARDVAMALYRQRARAIDDLRSDLFWAAFFANPQIPLASPLGRVAMTPDISS